MLHAGPVHAPWSATFHQWLLGLAASHPRQPSNHAGSLMLSTSDNVPRQVPRAFWLQLGWQQLQTRGVLCMLLGTQLGMNLQQALPVLVSHLQPPADCDARCLHVSQPAQHQCMLSSWGLMPCVDILVADSIHLAQRRPHFDCHAAGTTAEPVPGACWPAQLHPGPTAWPAPGRRCGPYPHSRCWAACRSLLPGSACEAAAGSGNSPAEGRGYGLLLSRPHAWPDTAQVRLPVKA